MYLDETWYDSHDAVGLKIKYPSSSWKPDYNSRKRKRLDPRVSSFFQSKILRIVQLIIIKTWMEFSLKAQESIIVMDNAKYYSRLLIKKTSQATQKEEILNFMTRHKIHFAPRNTKKDVLLILKNYEIQAEHVDKMAHEKGHTIVRLLPYYYVLNANGLIWSDLKRGTRQRNSAPHLSAQKRIGSNLWKNCSCTHVPELSINSANDSNDDNFKFNVNQLLLSATKVCTYLI